MNLLLDPLTLAEWLGPRVTLQQPDVESAFLKGTVQTFIKAVQYPCQY